MTIKVITIRVQFPFDDIYYQIVQTYLTIDRKIILDIIGSLNVFIALSSSQ